MKRRVVVRTAVAKCPQCESRVTVGIPPVVYARNIIGRRESDTAFGVDCVCGERVDVTIGEARRAA